MDLYRSTNDIFQHARCNDQMVAVIAKKPITVEMEHIRTHNDGKFVIKDVCYTSRIGCSPAPTPKKHKETVFQLFLTSPA